MGLCQSSERSGDERIRVYAYDIAEGKAAELKEHLANLGGEAAKMCEMVAIGIDEDSSPNKLIFASLAQDQAANQAFMTQFAQEHKADLDNFCGGSPTFTSKGTAFSAGTVAKGKKPVANGQYLRIVKIPGDDVQKVKDFSKAVRKKLSEDGIVPGMQCSGYAHADDGSSVHGYQCFDTKEHADAYTKVAKEVYAEQGLEKTGFMSACGPIVHAHQTSSFLGYLPAGEEVAFLSTQGRDQMDNIFLHLPGGAYVVDGTTFVVDSSTNIGSTITSTATDGTKKTWEVTADGLKAVPGGEQVVEGAEGATKATVDAASQGADLVNKGTDAVVAPTKDLASQGMSATTAAGQSAIDADPTGASKTVQSTTTDAVKTASSTAKSTAQTTTPDVGTKGMAKSGSAAAKGKDEKGNASCVVS